MINFLSKKTFFNTKNHFYPFLLKISIFFISVILKSINFFPIQKLNFISINHFKLIKSIKIYLKDFLIKFLKILFIIN